MQALLTHVGGVLLLASAGMSGFACGSSDAVDGGPSPIVLRVRMSGFACGTGGEEDEVMDDAVRDYIDAIGS